MKKFLVTLFALAIFFGGIAGVYYFYKDTNCNLTVSVSPANSGIVLGNDEKYDSGATVELVASPSTGYEFDNWTEGGVVKDTDATYTFTIRKDTNVTANFKLKDYTLTFVNGDSSESRTLHYGDVIGTLPSTALIWKIDGLVITANSLYYYTSDKTAIPSSGTQVETEKCNIVFNYSGIFSYELPTTMETTMENAVVQDTIDNFFQSDYPTKSLTGNRDFIAWTTVNPTATPAPTYAQLVAGIVDNEEVLGNFVIEHSGQTVRLYAIWGDENTIDDPDDTCNIVFNYGNTYSIELPTTNQITMTNATTQDTIDNFFQDDYPTKSVVANKKFVGWTTINPSATPEPTLEQLFAGIVNSTNVLGNFVNIHDGLTVNLYAIWGWIDSALDESTSYNFDYGTVDVTGKLATVVATKGTNNTLQKVYFEQTNALQVGDRVSGFRFDGLSMTSGGSVFNANLNLDNYLDYYTGNITFYACWTDVTTIEAMCNIRFNFIEASQETSETTITANNVSTTNTLNDALGENVPLNSASNNKLFVGWSTEDIRESNLHVVIDKIIDSTTALGTFVSQHEDETVDLYALWGQTGSSNDNELINRTVIEFDFGENEANLNETYLRSVTTVGGENDTLEYLYFGEATSNVLSVGEIVGSEHFGGFSYNTLIPYAIDEDADLTPYIMYYSGNFTLYAIWN